VGEEEDEDECNLSPHIHDLIQRTTFHFLKNRLPKTDNPHATHIQAFGFIPCLLLK
jgi:hypothetical protein